MNNDGITEREWEEDQLYSREMDWSGANTWEYMYPDAASHIVYHPMYVVYIQLNPSYKAILLDLSLKWWLDMRNNIAFY